MTAENHWMTAHVQKVKPTNVTQIFHIPQLERAFKQSSNFGAQQSEQNKVCADIQQRTSTQIEMSTCRDGSLSIMVSGRSDNVLKARREIFSRLQTKSQLTLSIPKEHHRFILGKAGARLKKLELDTATKINIPRPDDNSTQITISGAQEGLHQARAEIQLISDEQAKLAIERLNFERAYHPFLCGPRNSIINELTQDNNVRINVPPPSVKKDEIVISGDRDAVAKAVARLTAIYKEKKATCKTISVEIVKSQHRFIIGQRGNTLQDILAETGVAVELPATDSLSETVVLLGEQQKLGEALTVVYAKANSVVIRSVTAPGWLHRYIIGKKGVEIKALNEKYSNVNVEFKTEADEIVCTGPPEQVDPLQGELEEKIAEYERDLSFAEVTIDPKYFRNIIGKGGQYINKLRDAHKVQINIPSDNDKTSSIRIEGNKEGVDAAAKELRTMGDRLENERSKDVLIEHRFHRNIIGQKGDNIKTIRERFPEVNISFPDANLKSDVVNVRGPKNDVEKCYKYLKQMADDMLEKSYRIEVPIFKQYHRNIIGKGGANIRKIRDDTSTQIEMPDENSNNEVITIIGKKADCERARKMIRSIEQEQANIIEESIDISSKLHNYLIGSKGRLVRSVKDECGNVQIHFPTSDSGSDTVTLRGAPEDVKKAKDQLLDLAKQRELNSYTADVNCKSELHRYLIGKNGANINKVREETGARVIFPGANDPDKTLIMIMGKQEDVEKAKVMLESQISSLENITEIEMDINRDYHKHFVAKRGAILRDISSEYGGVTISFPRIGEDSEVVRIKGPSECVEGAKARMLEIVDDLENHVEVVLEVEEKYHRTLIGVRGKIVQGIIEEFNVQVRFPNRNGPKNSDAAQENGAPVASEEQAPAAENSEENTAPAAEEEPAAPAINRKAITISGHKDKCELAKKALEALVPVSEEVEVPYKYHRYIIGQKGVEVRKLMQEFDVNISIPNANLKSDVITITGTVEKLERAKEGLADKVKVYEKEEEDKALRNFALEIEVPSRYHSQIIGRRGATVTELRKKHDVNIQFPARDDPDANMDLIRVVGYEHNAEAARDAIMSIVGELESHVSQDVHIDRRVHPRLIGARGRAISKIMSDYHVDIRFPKDADIVTVTGAQDKVEECIEHILNLEEEFMQDISEQEENRRHQAPRGNQRSNQRNGGGGHNQPFMVRDAPWHQQVDTNNMEDFPSLGNQSQPSNQGPSAWGRRM